MTSDEPVPTKVVIATGPLTVTVEAPGITLAVAKRTAVALYRQIWRDDMRNTGSGMAGVGFVAERSDEWIS